MDSIDTKVKEIISKVLGCDVNMVEDDTAIGDIPEWDSLRHIKIISMIETEFGFRFAPDVMMDLEDVGDIIEATKLRCDN